MRSQVEAVEGTNEYRCTICGKRFLYHMDVVLHVREHYLRRSVVVERKAEGKE